MAKKYVNPKGIVIPIPGHSVSECSNYQTLPNEVWEFSPILGEFYEVSNLGRIRSLDHESEWFNGHRFCIRKHKGRILRGTLSKDGYVNVTVRKARHFVHRLVASTYLGNSKLTVNHKNGIKIDNRIENLEYMSIADNIHHAMQNGLLKPIPPQKSGNPKKVSEEHAKAIRELYRTQRYTQKDLAKIYGLHKDTIGRICRQTKAYSIKIQEGGKYEN